MSSENIKKIYILNLDKKRIIILSGILLFFFGLSFLAGLKWEREPVLKSSGYIEKKETPENVENPVIFSNPLAEEKSLLALPEEDNRIFNKSAQIEEDPFLQDPPAKSVKEAKPRIKEKTVEKKPNMRIAEKKSKSEEKYFTIQLAAFAHEKDAQSYKKDLIKKGLDARVDQGKLYYYVRVGKSNEKDELDTLFKKIQDTMKIQAVLVQRKIS